MNPTLTGIKEFDEEIGEIQPGSLIIIHGGPGTGKTTFALSFLKGGVENSEKTVFVTFVERRNDIIRYSKTLNIDIENLEAKGKIKVIEVPTLVKGLETVLNEILNITLNIKAKRLILDSFSAIRDILGSEQDIRAFIHNVFLKFLKNQGVTVLITLEKLGKIYEPTVEEYVADIVMDIDQKFKETYIRELTIRKFRGKVLKRKKYCFTIYDGFKIIKPITKPIKEAVLHEVLKDTKSRHFSTGIGGLDKVIGGGFETGSINLVVYSGRIPVSPLILVTPIIYQFVLRNRGVRLVAPLGYTAQQVRETLSETLSIETIDKYCRIVDYGSGGGEHIKQVPHIEITGCIDEDFKLMHKILLELEKETEKPILAIDFIGVFEELYNTKLLSQHLLRHIAYIRETGNIMLLITAVTSNLYKELAALSDVYLYFFEQNGAILVKGVKPATEAYVFQPYVKDRVRSISLIPVV